MGFLSSLFGRRDDEEEEELEEIEEEQAEEEEETKPADDLSSKIHTGTVLQVTIHKGEPLLSGRVTAFTGTELTLERTPGQLSFETCAIGTDAHLRGYEKNNSTPFDLKGVIAESTRMKCQIKNLELIPYSEQRVNFRLTLHTPVKLFEQDDTRMENPEDAELVDVSVTGACFQSEYIHGEGEILRMKFQINDYVPRTLLGQIVRVQDCGDGKFRYGFLFAQLDDQQTNALTRELFNAQVGHKRVHSRKGYGSWM